MDYDVLLVGAGPASLSAAIRIKQLGLEKGTDLSVCVVEKGAEVGSHIISGNVFEPRALNELIPDWKEKGAPLDTPVTDDRFLVTSKDSSWKLPNFMLPPQQLTRWLGAQAEELGVEIYPGFSASEVLYREDGGVRGIATRDVGINKDGTPKETFARGMELRGRVTLFGEGCRGSCSEEVMGKFDLRKDAQPQTYGLGIKEVWRIPKEKHSAGYELVQHTLGWPLQSSLFDKTFGGSFLYHMDEDLVQIGVGGYHAIPKLTFPGGGLIGCSAGFLNSIKIKGSHTAMKSGMLAAEAAFEALTSSGLEPVAVSGAIDENEPVIDISSYETKIQGSWVYEELKKVRNTHQSFHWGALPGVLYSGLSAFILNGHEPWTLGNDKSDSAKTKPAKDFSPIEYPKPDGVLTFDLLSNLQRSGTNHADQPAHLRIKPGKENVPSKESLPVFAGPEQRFCPAKVYEYTDGSEDGVSSS
ncbi:hypothetical protein DYB32_007507 [Aphanomyces invadans]|uniref:Electron transfer flavoprotein-ubiquinone oxidoreductase n=1 Tax=Aphanomyces invadans TaxID=157072 RepID=A0A3R6WHZ4_9STRA|nr:hypothetical protein DYB32_007507 [Aphanomyces invadans]